LDGGDFVAACSARSHRTVWRAELCLMAAPSAPRDLCSPTPPRSGAAGAMGAH